MTDASEVLQLKTERDFAPLFNSLDEGVIVWDATRTLVYANEAARRITRLPLVIGTPLTPIADTDVRVVTHTNEYAQSGALPVYRAFDGEDVLREDMHYIDPTGAHRWLSVSARRIVDGAGELQYIVSSLRDISVRKSRESKLEFMVESAKILSLNLNFKQRLLEKAKLTVPNLADWCIIDVLDENNKLERVALVHDDEQKVSLITTFEAMHPSDLARHDGVMHAIQNQQPLFVATLNDSTLVRANLSDEHLAGIRGLGIRSFMVVPIVSRGTGVGALTLAYAESGRNYDESDLEFFQEFCSHLSVVFDNARLFEEIETRDKSREIFLAALSHELRNPLAPIKSSLELLKLSDAPRDIREELDIIEHQFDHMAHLLNDLLDVTRFTQDRISLSSRPIELRRLVERAQRATDALVRNADITLHFTYPSTSLSVVADETRLEQAVSNLLSNAVKFTPAGGSIWVDLERMSDDAVIRVRDNGAGIEENDLPNIFDMYYQGANKGPVNSGLGIGLLLVQRIIVMHGGTVEAQSAGRGEGSEFTIRLPLVDTHATEVMPAKPRSLAHGLRILVVDDNAPAADSLVRLLNKLGAQAQAVYSAHEALGCAKLAEIDLFLLDVGMPQMDGYELVTALRKSGITAPIVALTGYGLNEDKQRAFGAGFTSHLTKPVGLSDLNEVFENALTVSV